ncbi:molybdate ABC transporter substrate-binding protein [Pirellulales bacterium]|nr:molybdate ABC transporter substrate-binding protein [Pirellulales bacterium]
MNKLRKLFETMNPVYSSGGLTLVVFIGLVYLLTSRTPHGLDGKVGDHELIVYCAAGLRLPAEQIAQEYQQQYGVSIRLQYGGSNTLLSQLEVSKIGDLYLAADDGYVQIAKEKGLVVETIPLARMRPVVVVPHGNPKQVLKVEDLLREDVRVALANPDQAAMGKVTRECLTATGQWKALESRVRQTGVFKPTVNDVVNDVALGSVDAGIVWDAVAAQHPNLEPIHVGELSQGNVLITVGVLAFAKNPSSALHFARFLTARNRGLLVFEEHGYEPQNGDAWSDDVQLTLFAGAVNRQVLDPIVNAFEVRHGVEVLTVYNGCGILTAQMRTIKDNSANGFPDAFMACDVYYMEAVNEMFQEAVNVSDTRIVIAVQSGNPKNISKVADLTNPGVRVALGQPDQCTIGVLSRRLLEAAGVYETVIKDRAVTQTATSSLLIPSVATGAADAALVYLSDAQAAGDRVDVVPIASELAQAVQPFAIAKASDHQQLGRMLFEAVASSRENFEAAGFRWRLDDD